MKKQFIAVFLLGITAGAMGQKKTAKTDSLPVNNSSKPDSTKPAAAKPQPYSKVITEKFVTRKGVITVHQQDESFYFEIPDSLLGRDILLVTRVTQTPFVPGTLTLPMGLYAGDEVEERVIRFEKGPGDKIFLRDISYQVQSADSSENGLYRSVLQSNVQPILAALPVKAYNPQQPATVVDVTDLVGNDNSLLSIASAYKSILGVGAFQKDRSYVKYVKPFAQNIEIKTLRTYASPGKDPMTFELNNSLVLLPKVPMQPRYSDKRVGYFSTGYVDFDANPQGVKKTDMITRWRLEPRPEDMEKYKRGELVEPQKPIVIYVDPATPKKWVPYLIQGVNDWQKAFEQAGFKNAIIAKEAPLNDSTWSLDDAAHSAIVYKPSDVPNAMGPHVHDPRSGEILETHISWYHNVMKILRNWYFVQAGAIDPRAMKMELEDTLMGQLIRFVSSHEVGHTLGLMHNFGSSSTVPVDSLRNKKWVEKYGHTPSIMDYARFNYVAQPEDSIGEKGIFPRINDYDKWAIEWGYRLFPDIKDPKAETALLNKWIIDSVSKNHRLWYGPQPAMIAFDPRNQNEDLSDNAVKAGNYGIKNLKRILAQMPLSAREPNEVGYSSLYELYKSLLKQYCQYAVHVLSNVSGFYIDFKTVEEKDPQFRPLSRSRQKEAVAFLDEQVFQTPKWLFNKVVLDNVDPSMDQVNKYGSALMEAALGRTGFLLLQERCVQMGNGYTAVEYLADLKKSIWRELATGKAIDFYRRDLQNTYINEMLDDVIPDGNRKMVAPQAGNNADRIALSRAHLVALLPELKASVVRFTDPMSKAHIQLIIEKVHRALYPNK